jgi:hypothetical protein
MKRSRLKCLEGGVVVEMCNGNEGREVPKHIQNEEALKVSRGWCMGEKCIGNEGK